MAKKSTQRKKQQSQRGADQQDRSGRPRKPIVYEYKRNTAMGVGMILFTIVWIVILTPMIAQPGTRIIGYVLLAVVSLINWTMVAQAFRIVPWAPKEIVLDREGVTIKTVAGRSRATLSRITRVKVQKNPVFLFSRGLVITGIRGNGKGGRENVMFGDLGRERVYELKKELESYT